VDDSEEARLAFLHALDVLDTGQEERFDRFTRIAARAFDAPIALVSLVDRDRQWFKSRVGLEALETSRDVAFCHYAVIDRKMVVVPDATKDLRFANNPLVTGPPHIRFYAGAPILSPGGSHVLGTVCVIDTKPRTDYEDKLPTLTDLAGAVSHELAAGVTRDTLEESFQNLDMERALHKLVMDNAPAFIAVINPDLTYRLINAEFARLSKSEPQPGMSVLEVLGPEAFQVVEPHLHRALQGENVHFVAEGVDTAGAPAAIDIQYVPNFDSNGEVESITSLGIDVTRRLRFQQALGALTEIGLNTDENVVGKTEQALRRLQELMGMEFAGIARLKDDGEFVLQGGRPLSTNPQINDLAHYIAAQGTELVVDDADVEFPNAKIVKNPKRVRAFAGAPVMVGSKVWGVIGLGSHQPRISGFLDIELEILRLAASIIARDILQTQAAEVIADREATLHALATTDPLTGLNNRREFMNHMGTEISRMRRYGRNLSLAIIDLDHFKAINDEYGHPAGDQVLVQVTAILESVLREADHICRIGGEEFAIILPETSLAGAEQAMEKIIARISEFPIEVDGQKISTTASAGRALCSAADTVETLIKRTDTALYSAKDQGRNQVVFDVQDDRTPALQAHH